jgi:lantibiotic biosynthesis protein
LVNLLSVNTTTAISKEALLAAFKRNHQSIEDGNPAGNYLLTGKLGLVLYYFSLYEAFDEDVYANRCVELLEEVMNQEDDMPAPLAGTGFANGTAGLGYILSVLQKNELIDINLADDLQELDSTMAAIALQQITEEDRIDFVHGAMGVVHYFITRSKEPVIKENLEQLITALLDNIVVTNEGSWFRNFIMDKKEKERIDLGLSHGNAGFLLILLDVFQAGIFQDKVRDVVAQGVEFILFQQMETNTKELQYAVFPFSVHSKHQSDKYYTQRLAWCYGDLNIMLLLYRAASILENPAWKIIADGLADKVLLRRDVAATLASDAHFCHGTAGLAQFYYKLYCTTNDVRFNEAAEYWINKTVQYNESEWKEGEYVGKECDLLNGLPGINLALLSFISKKELTWGQLLLL